MNALHRLALAVSRLGALVGGLMLLLAAVVIGIDILMRAVLSRSIGGADELSGYALAIATAWGLSFALLYRAHIRIDSLYELLPPAARASLDLVSLLGFAFFMGLVAWHGWGVLSQSLTSSTRSISALATPLAIPQALWFCGLVFLILVLVLLLVEALAAWGRSDLKGLARLIGSKAVREEVEEEIKQSQPAAGAGQP